MIRHIEALEYLGVAAGGRNEPLQVTGVDSDGELLDLYLKPSGRPELGFEGLSNELLAAMIAGELGLPVCEPLIVSMTPEWIATIPDNGLRVVLQQSCPLAFGSRGAGKGWKLWSDGDTILSDRRAAALSIFAFDAFTGNADRRDVKPNLLVRGPDLRMIDHELCFGLRMKLFPRVAPWELGNLSHLTNASQHVLGPLLKGNRTLDFAALRTPWANIADDRLADFEACIPIEWSAAAAAMTDAITHVKTVRDRIDDCLVEIERTLR
ncbi:MULTISPECIES: HipA family kinase [unclassified Sphingopyxis]|uniref:HipA family kinase n=1 Tax=unclassified Sphingopyxis TaxID=2614943 RepID=UPI000730CB8E|nr:MULTISPECIES: HipA family kinase [unclassified Sphingopyxis]KTE25168.1 hypothetical protein ATE61_11745 [Sphingopyxis sp. H057]KTE53738.1 hypothetical protein ATE64_07700 [Sphingopyxis sp. H073]KTE56330.1 hypothetical protein ATE69_07685 [Sphingopyxis sp. H071]KTE62023.1 hypothetical protein ATE66_04540 [Sphingopyxis sp. H107]KTE66594.1 hypothetical protein ATE60_19965 [Sphingopyxis sp. H081]